MASWVIGYGLVQSIAPRLTGRQRVPGGRSAAGWALLLALLPAAIALGMQLAPQSASAVLIGGLLLFGVVFAINSSLHSYLIVSYAKGDGVSLDVGFYYMSNAMGRLIGTLLSGWVYQQYGLAACLWTSSAFVLLAGLISLGLPAQRTPQQG
jgi:predicted MFS family arabinose efflux permease